MEPVRKSRWQTGWLIVGSAGLVGLLAWQLVETISLPVGKTAGTVSFSTGAVGGGHGARHRAAVAPPGPSADTRVARETKLIDRILEVLATDGSDVNEVLDRLIPELLRLDPQAAASFAQSARAAKWRSLLMMGVARSWASMDPDHAQQWANGLSSLDGPLERETMICYVGLRIAETDPQRAVEVFEQSPIGSDRREVMVESLAQRWAEKDLGPLIQWIAQMPPNAERDGLFRRIALAQTQSSPVKAAWIVSSCISPGSTQQEAALDVVRQWKSTDQAKAAEWVKAFPAGSLREAAETELNSRGQERSSG